MGGTADGRPMASPCRGWQRLTFRAVAVRQGKQRCRQGGRGGHEPGAADVPLAKTLAQLGLAASGSEARRLIAQGGVSVEGTRASDPNARLAPGVYLLKVGKRKFTRVTVK